MLFFNFTESYPNLPVLCKSTLMNRLFFFCLALTLVACGGEIETRNSTQATTNSYSKIAGKTMGTTYHVTYSAGAPQLFKRSIDSLLVKINREVSTYEKNAIISQFNRSEKGVALDASIHAHFFKNFDAALNIHKATSGNFDPTVMPLVNYWGFGYADKRVVKNIDSLKIKETLNLIGMNEVLAMDESLFLSKKNPKVQLDFSAHAKGYGVDQVCQLLTDRGVENYYVEIGGELRAKGKNSVGMDWITGVNKPQEKAALTDFMFRIQLKDEAIATSGNYRNVYEVDGIKYFHTISPFTGYPQRNRLLSASVIAKDCMTADAYATAFMVMGLDAAFAYANTHDDLKAIFIYSDDQGQMQLKKTTDATILE